MRDAVVDKPECGRRVAWSDGHRLTRIPSSMTSLKPLYNLSNLWVFCRKCVLKIALTISTHKCTKYRLAVGLCPDPLGSLHYSAPPDFLDEIREPTSKRRRMGGLECEERGGRRR